MCRLAFLPKGTNVETPRIGALLQKLDELMGGDGVGVGTWKGKDAEVIKAVRMKGQTAGRILRKKGNENGWLYHARARSAGPVIDQLNQPFSTGNYLFVHNGHYTDWEHIHFALMANKAVKPNMPMNDSRAIAHMVQGADDPDVLQWLNSGVYITWKRGEPWPVAYIQSGDFAYSSLPTDEGGGLVYASTFPADWPMAAYEFKRGTKVILKGDDVPEIVWGDAPQKLVTYSRGRYKQVYPQQGTAWNGHHMGPVN